MSRNPSSVIKIAKPDLWIPVVRWISARFSAVDLQPDEHFIVSPSIANDLNQNISPAESVRNLRLSWEKIALKWRDEMLTYADAGGRGPAESLLMLIAETNNWIDTYFPPSKGPLGIERRRLLASLRQRKLRNTGKYQGKPSLGLPKQVTLDVLSVADQHHVDPSEFLVEAVKLVLATPRLTQIICRKLK